MKAKDIMTVDVAAISSDCTIADAVKLMMDRRISGVPVVDDLEKLVGIITEGDLMRHTEMLTGRRPWWLKADASTEEEAAAFVKAHGRKVKDVMTRNVVTLDENDSHDQIALILEKHGIKRAPVVKNGKIIGIVSRANLIRSLASAIPAGTAPSDGQMRSAIMATASRDAGVRLSFIDVTVANGVAHLWGSAGSEAEREAIRVVAETTPGVSKVQNHIRILPPTDIEYLPE